MKPIFDRTGGTVGWIVDDVIFDANHQARAFLLGEAVFSWDHRQPSSLVRSLAIRRLWTQFPPPPVSLRALGLVGDHLGAILGQETSQLMDGDQAVSGMPQILALIHCPVRHQHLAHMRYFDASLIKLPQ